MANTYNQDMMNAEETRVGAAKCPTCGSNMSYNPDAGNLKCDHCGTVQDFESVVSRENAFESLLTQPQNQWSDKTKVMSCQNCGAKEIVERTSISVSCPFCGTTSVVEANELSGLKPNAVVPFKINKDEACNCVLNWAKRKYFAPNQFRKEVYPEKIAGTYNPCFTYDTVTVTRYSGMLQKIEYYTVQVGDRTETRTRTINIPIHGIFNSAFDDVLIQASDNIDQKSIDDLQPFYTNDAREYTDNFLQGYAANQYSKDGIKCWHEAKDAIESRIADAILNQYDYDRVVTFNAQTSYSNITYKYVLVPVYVGHNIWREKLYNFFVNGYTGSVTGKSPLSPIKVASAVFAGLCLLAGIIVLVLYYTVGF